MPKAKETVSLTLVVCFSSFAMENSQCCAQNCDHTLTTMTKRIFLFLELQSITVFDLKSKGCIVAISSSGAFRSSKRNKVFFLTICKMQLVDSTADVMFSCFTKLMLGRNCI